MGYTIPRLTCLLHTGCIPAAEPHAATPRVAKTVARIVYSYDMIRIKVTARRVYSEPTTTNMSSRAFLKGKKLRCGGCEKGKTVREHDAN